MKDSEVSNLELKSNYQELFENNTILQNVLTVAKIGTWKMNLNEHFAIYSETCCLIYGFTAENNKHTVNEWIETIYEDDRERVQKIVTEAYLDLKPITFECRIVTTTNQIKYVSQSTVFFFDTSGKPISLHGIVHDLTRQKLAEQSIIKSNNKLAALIEYSTDIIIITDADRVVKFASPGIKCTLGYEVDEILGETSIGIYHDDERAVVNDTIQNLIRDGENATASIVCRCRHKVDGWRWLNITFTNHYSTPGIEGMVGNGHDITELKKAKDETDLLNALLELKVYEKTKELETKNNDLESFVAAVSHDLRSPLRTIRSFAQLLNKEINIETDPGKAREMLETISDYALRMNNIINDLLTLFRLSSKQLELKDVNIDEIVKGVLTELKYDNHYAKHTIKVEQLGQVKGDPGLLYLLFQNIIANALKYSSKVHDPKVEIGVFKGKDDCRTFFVADNGAGFEDSFQKHLFTPFKRGDSTSEFEGTGIGLAIVSRIITKHNGKVWAESKVNKGSMFYIEIPN